MATNAEQAYEKFQAALGQTEGTGEWFEVKALAAVDLNGLQGGTSTLGATPLVPAAGNCVRVAANGYAVFARTAMNNGLPAKM